MSLGVAMFLGALGFLVVVSGLQWAASRSAKAMQGKPVPHVDGPLNSRIQGDVVLWFHSKTCGPCRAMAPWMAELADDGIAEIVDVQDDLELARAFGVMATPTTVGIRDGHVFHVQAGAFGRQRFDTLFRRSA